MKSAFKILGLKPGSNPALIKSQYRVLAKKYHPDISREENAEEKFIQITEAYEFLLQGPRKRKVNPAQTANDRESERREKARSYARMEYEHFKRNNEAFKKEWYYTPTKYFSYALIGFG